MRKRESNKSTPVTLTMPRPSVRTPWGSFEQSPGEEAIRDPFEPDEPVKPGDVPPLSPRELYEMLRMPSAQPTRSSPLRLQPDPASESSPPVQVSADPKAIPAQAELVLSALEAGQSGSSKVDRRSTPRKTFHSKSVLRFFSDNPGTPPWLIYTRDFHGRGVGFITQHRLPLGYNGVLEMPDPLNPSETVRLACTLLRCRPAAAGWFEGSVYFDRERPEYAA